MYCKRAYKGLLHTQTLSGGIHVVLLTGTVTAN